MKVFILQHVHPEDDIEDVKTLGVYSSQENAERARKRYLRLPGFRDWPAGFCVGRYDIDQDEWTDGFVSMCRSATGDDGPRELKICRRARLV